MLIYFAVNKQGRTSRTGQTSRTESDQSNMTRNQRGRIVLYPPTRSVKPKFQDVLPLVSSLSSINDKRTTINETLIAQQDIINASNINTGDESVAVHVAGGDIGLVAVEQVVVETSDIY